MAINILETKRISNRKKEALLFENRLNHKKDINVEEGKKDTNKII